MVVREQITHDTNRICADGGTIRLAPIGPDRLDWRYFWTDGREGASSTLTRR